MPTNYNDLTTISDSDGGSSTLNTVTLPGSLSDWLMTTIPPGVVVCAALYEGSDIGCVPIMTTVLGSTALAIGSMFTIRRAMEENDQETLSALTKLAAGLAVASGVGLTAVLVGGYEGWIREPSYVLPAALIAGAAHMAGMIDRKGFSAACDAEDMSTRLS